MNNTRKYKICFLCSGLLVIIFFLNTIRDYVRYNTTLNSAPFYLCIIINAVCFLLPALILFIVGLLDKRKDQT